MRCFASVLQYVHKTHKTPEKHRNETLENSQYARVLRESSKSKTFRLYCTKHLSQNICKTLHNTTKHQSEDAFCEITSQNTAKRTQNARKRHKTLTIQAHYVLRAFGVFSQNTLNLSRKHTIRSNIRLNYGGGSRIRRGSRSSRIVDDFQKQFLRRCFAMFCDVLRCFVCVFLAAFFTKQHKTDQTVYKTHKAPTKYALCNTAQYGAVHLSLTQKMSTKNIRKTRPKHCKTSAKHHNNTVFVNTLLILNYYKTPAKHPQNTKHRKTPQNTTKHVLTKQNELANKPLRSPPPPHCGGCVPPVCCLLAGAPRPAPAPAPRGVVAVVWLPWPRPRVRSFMTAYTYNKRRYHSVIMCRIRLAL